MSKKRIRTRYEFIDKPIGEGAYGYVYKAYDFDFSETVALKKIRMDEENEGIPATALREIALLKELRHPNLVALNDVEHFNAKYWLVFEWVDQDLKKFIEEHKKKDGLTRIKVKDIMFQLLEGLEYCHAHSVFHRDLKPQNILVNQAGRVKIADFGLARAFSIPLRTYTHEVVTLWYRAPEILLNMKKYSLPIDMWSVGCIFAELCDGKALWQGDSEIDQLFKIFRALGTPNDRVWPGVQSLEYYNSAFPKWPPLPFQKVVTKGEKLTKKGQDLLKKMFIYNPANRITARTALKHEYFLSQNEDPAGTKESPIVLE